jgi:hypothetical protein
VIGASNRHNRRGSASDKRKLRIKPEGPSGLIILRISVFLAFQHFLVTGGIHEKIDICGIDRL